MNGLFGSIDEPRFAVEVRRRIEAPDCGPVPENWGEWGTWETVLVSSEQGANGYLSSIRRANKNLDREYRVTPAPTDRVRWGIGASDG